MQIKRAYYGKLQNNRGIIGKQIDYKLYVMRAEQEGAAKLNWSWF